VSTDAAMQLQMVIRAVDNATAPIRAVRSAMEALRGTAQSMGLQSAGRTLDTVAQHASRFAAQSRSAMESVLGPTLEFETQLARLGPSMGRSGAEVNQALASTREAARRWQREHAQSAAEYVRATDAIIGQGIALADSQHATEVAMRVAMATGRDSAAVSSSLATVYRRWGRENVDATEEFERLGDVLAQAQLSFAGLDPSALPEVLERAVPAARHNNVALEQTLAMIGTLQQVGVQGGRGASMFTELTNNMASSSRRLGFTLERTEDGAVDMVRTIQSIRNQMGPLEEMAPRTQRRWQQAFGDQGWEGLVLLTQQSEQLVDGLDSIETSTDAAAEAAALIEDSPAMQMAQIQLEFADLGMELARALLPVVRELVPLVRDAVEWFMRFAQENPALTRTVAIVGTIFTVLMAVVAPALAVLVAIVGFVGTVGGVAALFVGAIVVAIGAVILWVIAAWEAWKLWGHHIRQWWETARAAFGAAQTALVAVVTNMRATVASWIGWFSSLSLLDVGRRLIGTLAGGMRSAAGQPVEAARAMVQRIRNLLPFSPAKEGPLQDLDRIQLMETVAGSVRAKPLVDAMGGATREAMGAMPTVASATPFGRFAPEPASLRAAPASGPMTVHFHLEGGRDPVSALEAWITSPSNAQRLAAAVDRAKRSAERTELS
jgi:TP901 family phage tail tape measure protein